MTTFLQPIPQRYYENSSPSSIVHVCKFAK